MFKIRCPFLSIRRIFPTQDAIFRLGLSLDLHPFANRTGSLSFWQSCARVTFTFTWL